MLLLDGVPGEEVTPPLLDDVVVEVEQHEHDLHVEENQGREHED